MLKGKTALVTGSTSGIGLGIAEALAKRGANIVLNGFGDKAEIERLRVRLTESCKVSVAYDGADLSKPDAIEAMLKPVLGRFGAVDILVNNAGIQPLFTQVPPSSLRSMSAVFRPSRSRRAHSAGAAWPTPMTMASKRSLMAAS